MKKEIQYVHITILVGANCVFFFFFNLTLYNFLLRNVTELIPSHRALWGLICSVLHQLRIFFYFLFLFLFLQN